MSIISDVGEDDFHIQSRRDPGCVGAVCVYVCVCVSGTVRLDSAAEITDEPEYGASKRRSSAL